MLDAAGWRCKRCSAYASEVDHITPISQGGDKWSRDNLQALCRGCHIDKTRKEKPRPILSPEGEKWRSLVDELM